MTNGEIVEKDGVKIALSDIGFLRMKEILDKNFSKYLDKQDNYIEPERNLSNDCVEIRLYCLHKDCKQYIKGEEGYNGLFVTENGIIADLKKSMLVL